MTDAEERVVRIIEHRLAENRAKYVSVNGGEISAICPAAMMARQIKEDVVRGVDYPPPVKS